MRVLAWGCGTPSTTVGVLSALGEIDQLDAIIHADTGWEREETIKNRQYYTRFFEQHGIPVHIVSNGDIGTEAANAHVHPPFWTSDGGPLRRQCTQHFKIVPQKRKIRELLGYDATQAPHPPAASAEQWFGYTWDEWERMFDADVKFIVNRYPLIERRMTRGDCADYLRRLGLPVPPKSACVCCPYRKASEWLEMRQELGREWQSIVELDARIRDNPLAKDGSNAKQLFVYKHKQPLTDADFATDAERERDVAGFQLPMLCRGASCLT